MYPPPGHFTINRRPTVGLEVVTTSDLKGMIFNIISTRVLEYSSTRVLEYFGNDVRNWA